MSDKRRIAYEKVFLAEDAVRKAAQARLRQTHETQAVPREAFEELTEAFDRLLKQAIRLTRTGDRIEGQLMAAQKDLKEQNLRTERMNRELTELNEEKNDFLNLISHDLRSPLSGVLGILELMRHPEMLSHPETPEMIQTASEAVERIMRLIETLLDVNRIKQGTYDLVYGPCDLGSIARTVKTHYEPMAAAKGMTLALHQQQSTLVVKGDPDAIHRILDNLVSNAIKYSPQGSRIELTVESTKRRGLIHVKDQGPGLTDKDKDRLFVKYARLSAKPTGLETSTGIGLAIAKGLADQMQGELTCQSTYGQGAVFTLSLALTDDDTPQ